MRASRNRCLTALDQVNGTDPIFDRLQQAVPQQYELRHIALAMIEGTAAPAWSLDQGLLLFDCRFYFPAASPLLLDLLQVLLQGGLTHMALLALGCHPPLTTP